MSILFVLVYRLTHIGSVIKSRGDKEKDTSKVEIANEEREKGSKSEKSQTPTSDGTSKKDKNIIKDKK